MPGASCDASAFLFSVIIIELHCTTRCIVQPIRALRQVPLVKREPRMDVFSQRKDFGGLDSLIRKRIIQQTELVNKKNNVELEILSKICNYSSKRSVIEQEYGRALQSLRQQCGIEDRDFVQLGFCQKSVYGIWNAYLDEIKRLGAQHQSLGQFYSQNIAKNARNVHTSKTEAIKKCSEQLKKCTQELVASAGYSEKHRQMYLESSLVLSTAKGRMEAKAVAKREVKEHLEKMQLKVTDLEKDVHNSRNLYLIRLEATRTHQTWFTETAVPKFVGETEERVYDSLWTCLSAAACIELEHCKVACTQVTALSAEMEKLPNPEEYGLQFAGVFSQLGTLPALESEPLSSQHLHGANEDPVLSSEAKVWISSRIRAQKTIDEAWEKISKLEKVVTTNDNNPKVTYSSRDKFYEVSKQIERLKDDVRKAGITKLKAESILNKLRAAGVNCDEVIWLNGNEANMRSTNAISLLSLTSISLYGSELEDIRPTDHQPHYMALYNYEPKNDDELRICAGEILTLLDEPCGNSWPKAKNVRGQSGLVPSNYIKHLTDDSKVDNRSSPARKGSLPAYQLTQSSASVQTLFYCRAKYNYEAREPEELSFKKGDILQITDQAPHNVVDGWWKGSLVESGRCNGTTGTFPSMLVEKIPAEEMKNGSNFTSKLPNLERSPSIDLTLCQNRLKTARRQTWYAEGVAESDQGQRNCPVMQRRLSNSAWKVFKTLVNAKESHH